MDLVRHRLDLRDHRRPYQGGILATAVPGFPVWELAGVLGSTGWGLWLAALGVVILWHPDHSGSGRIGEAVSHTGQAPSALPPNVRPTSAPSA